MASDFLTALFCTRFNKRETILLGIGLGGMILAIAGLYTQIWMGSFSFDWFRGAQALIGAVMLLGIVAKVLRASREAGGRLPEKLRTPKDDDAEIVAGDK